MYPLDVIKSTALAKKLGGVPIFHDGYLHAVSITPETMTLDLQLLSQSNPQLARDTRVVLKLQGLRSFSLASEAVGPELLVIHDLDIRKKDSWLYLRLECTLGAIHEAVFESIELTDE